MRKAYTVAICLPIVLALLAAAVLAQADQGRIAGAVHDQTGGVIPGAAITIINEKTGEERTLLSDEEGAYVVNNLKPSSYTVRAKLAKFAVFEVTKVQLVVGVRLDPAIVLRPEGGSTTVDVVSGFAAPLETSSATMGVNVDMREIAGLPVNGRQASQLYLQAPGAQNTGACTFGDIRFNGRAVEQNALRYDGVDGTGIIDAAPGVVGGELVSPFRLQTSLENVQEFRVESSNYSAEFGTGTGGQVSVVTKSGGNQFHGSLFEFLRNDKMDARNTFDKVGKLPLRMNQYGGSIGGPIVKNKAFFFFNYEGYRLRSGVNLIEAVPSAAAKATAVASIAPIVDAFQDKKAVLIPGASTDPNFDIVQLAARNVVNENSFGLRLDFKASERHSVYARFFRDQAFSDQPLSVSGRRQTIRAFPQNGVLALQSMLSATLINEAKFGYNGALTRGHGEAPVVNGIDTSGMTISLDSTGVPNTGIPGQGTSTGKATAGGLVRLNSQANGRGAPYTPFTLSYIDNLSWTKGKHNMKFGGEVRMVRIYTDRNGGVTYSFSNITNFMNNVPSSIRYVGDLSDPSLFNGGATGQRLAKQRYLIGYAQDEWRIARKLAVNFGLRYEYYSPLVEDRNLMVLFDTVNGGLLPPTNAPYKAVKNNFGPRLAVVYSPDSKTVLRSGFGIVYGPGQTEDLIQPIESDLINTNITGAGIAFPLDVATTRANFAANTNNRSFAPRAYSPDYRVPEKVYQYSASVQRQFARAYVVTAGYVGSQGRNLFLRTITNQIVSVEPTTGFITRQFDIPQGPGVKPLTPFAEIDVKRSGGEDSYNALQLSFVRRSSSGVTMNSQYTYGKSYGTSAGSNEAISVGNNATGLAGFEYDRGYNSFDIRHNFNTSAVYTIPVGRGRRYLGGMGSVGNAILGGWETAFILNARSGSAINVLITRTDTVIQCTNAAAGCTAGEVRPVPSGAFPAGFTAVINVPGGGSSRDTRRPDLVPGVDPYLHVDKRMFINPAAFTAPQPGTFGNLPRNFLHGPTFKQADLMLSKRFIVREGTNVEFRTEFFNILNLTNFANPASKLSDNVGVGAGKLQPGTPFNATTAGSTFGTIASTVERSVGLGTQRQIQFALKVNF